MVFGRVVAAGEIVRAREQILEPHQRADPFVQRVLVANHWRGGQRAAGRHSAANVARHCASVESARAARLALRARGSADRGARPAARASSRGPELSITSSACAKPLGARQLRRHDPAHLVGRKAAAQLHASHLLLLGTVDDQHPRHALAQSAALEQQRHDEHCVGPAASPRSRPRAARRSADAAAARDRGETSDRRTRAVAVPRDRARRRRRRMTRRAIRRRRDGPLRRAG